LAPSRALFGVAVKFDQRAINAELVSGIEP